MTRKIYKSTFFCNRHTRMCATWHNNVKRNIEKYIKAWTRAIKLLPTTRNHNSVKVKRLSGQQCLQMNKMVRRPYTINIQKNPLIHITQLVNCMVALPQISTNVDVASVGDRVAFWQRTWHSVYHETQSFLPSSIDGVTNGRLRRISEVIDRNFWGGTLIRTFTRRNWSFFTRANPIYNGDLGMPHADYPAAGMSPHRTNRTLTIFIERDRRMWPRRYPFNCDGYPVANWKEYLVHTVAHELLHCFRVAMDMIRYNTRGNYIMYDETFDILNLWIHGHFHHQDRRQYDDEDTTEEENDSF